MKTLFFILALCNPLQVMAAQITAKVDRNPVSLNESFQLTYTADASTDGGPDFAPLKQHFEILSQEHRNEISLMNGKSSATVKWTLQLMAKQAGQQKIPSITFGQDKTEAVNITVSAANVNNDVNTNQDLLLKVEATPLNPYVQTQVLYTLRLYRKVNIAQARLDEPKLADAIIQKLGEDSNYNTQINGVDYVVTERKYAIFPQKSGTIPIAPLTLTAEVAGDDFSRFNSFFNPQPTRTQKITSNPITLEVRAAPANAQMAHWLPAEDLQLKQEWSADPLKIKMGEPITRTLTVVAKGTTVGLLPELHKAITDQQLKNYPDQPVMKEMQKPEGVYAFREEKVAFIPSRAGTFTLPAIEVPWFNTQTQTVQVAKIPEATLTVLATGATTAVPTPAPATVAPTATPMTSTQPTAFPAANAPIQSNRWMWVSLFLGLGWLSTLVYMWVTRKATATKATPAPLEVSIPPQQLIARVKQACQQDDPQQAKQALLAWGKAAYQVTSLGALADCCDARLRDEIEQLNQALYAQQVDPTLAPPPWQGKRLLQTFSEHQATQRLQASQPEDPLEPLYRL